MKFRWTVLVSILAHIGVFSLVYLKPSDKLKGSMTYYVDLVSMPGGGDGRPPGGGKRAALSKGKTEAQQAVAAAEGRVKDLSVAKNTPESGLSFPDEKKKPSDKRKQGQETPKKIEKMVTVVTKKDSGADKIKPSGDSGRPASDQDPFMRIGIGEGGEQGDGEGDGTGLGYGFGPGGSGGGYNYYYAALQNKIKNAWFNTAIASSEGSKIASIACRIHRNGQVSDVRVYQSSGDNNLDTSGLRAVKRAVPFPPMPASNPNQFIDVIFEFEGRKR